MLLFALLTPLSTPPIDQQCGRGRTGIMAVGNASTDDTATVLGSLAARVRAWLMQMGEPDSPLQGAMMRHIRSAALTLRWSALRRRPSSLILSRRSYQMFERPARFRGIGREGLRAVPRTPTQRKQRKHA